MITKRNTLALAVVASFGIAAAPAQAQETNTAAAVGAIDMSKVAAPTQTGEDAQFKQLFAQWDNLDRATPAATSVSVPSRMPLDNTKLTSDYGMRTHPVLGGRRNHKGVDLAAIAARGAPADARAFEHRDLVALLGEMQRRGQPAIARADDADLGVVLACQRRALGRGVGRGGVVGAGVASVARVGCGHQTISR